MILNPILPAWLLIIIFGGLIGAVVWKQKGVLRWVQIGSLVALMVIGLRPMYRNERADTYRSNVDVFFVVDNTLSMLAEDYDGTKRRMDGVISDIEQITKVFSGANTALISFANYSSVNLPPTSDTNALMTAVKTLRQTGAYEARGSTITMFKDDLQRLLKSSSDKERHQQIVIVFSDGENTSDSKLDNLEELKKYIDGGLVLGYGTSAGAGMKVDRFGSGQLEYLEDTSMLEGNGFRRAISKIDEDNLKKIAGELGLKYIHAPSKEIVSELQKIDTASTQVKDENINYMYNDLYYYFAPLVILGLVLNIYLIKGRRPV